MILNEINGLSLANQLSYELCGNVVSLFLQKTAFQT